LLLSFFIGFTEHFGSPFIGAIDDLPGRINGPGWAVLAGILGPDTDNNVAYQGFTFLLLLLILAFCSSFFFRARFSAIRGLPRFGTVGAPLTYTVTLKKPD
jgi:hypothetical protein